MRVGVKVLTLGRFQSTDDFPFDKHGEAFVEPKMLEIAIRNQISRPTVRDFVGHHVRQTSVARLKISPHLIRQNR